MKYPPAIPRRVVNPETGFTYITTSKDLEEGCYYIDYEKFLLGHNFIEHCTNSDLAEFINHNNDDPTYLYRSQRILATNDPALVIMGVNHLEII